MRKINVIGFIGLIAAGIIATKASAEEITMTTYYPSPYGVYSSLRLYPNDDFAPWDACSNEGEIHYDNSDNSLYVCGGGYLYPGGDTRWVPAPGKRGAFWSRAYNSYLLGGKDYVYATYAPDVVVMDDGNVGIGTTSPSGKLQVSGGEVLLATDSGNVGIGTDDPQAKLDVAGNIKLSGTLDGGSSNSAVRVLTNNQTYQNNGKRKLIVVAWGPASGGTCTLEGSIGTSSIPATTAASDTGTNERKGISFVVPVGWYYRVSLSYGVLYATAWEM